ncbi:hypothetical protein [Devosia indica]
MRRSPFLYPRQAEAHEALFVRVCALLDQLKPLAAKHPEGPVAPVVTRLATGMLGAVAWLVGEKRAGCVPAADLAGLVAQLSEARARLEHFEAQHSAWHKDQNAHVWLLRNGTLPIKRLRPHTTKPPRPQDDPEARQRRKELERRINAITKGLPLD